MAESKIKYKRLLGSDSIPIYRYVYDYHKGMDFLNVISPSKEESPCFEFINRDIYLNERLYNQIMKNPKTATERLEKYANCFPENLARIRHEDGSFSFILKSGKIIEDRFFGFENCGGKLENNSVAEVDYIEIENNQPVKKHRIFMSYYFRNEYNLLLLDANKVRTINDVCEILKNNPMYLFQIPPSFFKEKNLTKMWEVIDKFYREKMLYSPEGLLLKPMIEQEKEHLKDIEKNKVKILNKINERKLAEKIARENEFTYPKPVKEENIVRELLTDSQLENKFKDMYYELSIEEVKYLKKEKAKTNLGRLDEKIAHFEKKLEIIEKHRENLIYSKVYVLNQKENPLLKYKDFENEQKAQMEFNNKIDKDVEIIDKQILEPLNNEIIKLEEIKNKYCKVNIEILSNPLLKELNKNKETRWKLEKVYLPNFTNRNIGGIGNAWHRPVKCYALVNSNFPRYFKEDYLTNEQETKRKINVITRQIESGNIIVLCDVQFDDVILNNSHPNRERAKNCHETLSLNSSYCEIHQGIKEVIENSIEMSIKTARKMKKAKEENVISIQNPELSM